VVLGLFASRLELRTRYDALLPDSQPSVQELHRVEARTAGAQTVLILLEGPDRMALRALFVRGGGKSVVSGTSVG
jgi:hypothetical protein